MQKKWQKNRLTKLLKQQGITNKSKPRKHELNDFELFDDMGANMIKMMEDSGIWARARAEQTWN